jgi:ABC-type transport system substrate-binding protein
VQADLAKIGIEAELDFPDFGKFVTHMGPGTWPQGTMLAVPTPMLGQYFSGGLRFIFSFIGQSWLKTPELTQAYEASYSSPAQDIELIRAVTNIMTGDALLIPLCEAGICRAQQPYVVAGYGERGHTALWNSEDAWLNR